MPSVSNKYNLPQPFVDLVSESNYSKGEADITTTTLSQPPKVKELMRRHGDNVVEDASDRVWSMFGSANHWMLEQIGLRRPDRYITEQRFYMDVDGIKLGGQIDLFDKETGVLYDYKVSSVYKAMTDDKFDWTAQASINKLLCEHNGLTVKRAAIILVAKDWKKRDAATKPDYPKCPVVEIPLTLWGPEETYAYIKSRIRVHEQAKTLQDDEIPICTEKERWAKPTTYAVLKDKDAKRAVANGLYESRFEADAHAKKIGGIVSERAGADTRCESFCPVRNFCNYGKTLKVA